MRSSKSIREEEYASTPGTKPPIRILPSHGIPTKSKQNKSSIPFPMNSSTKMDLASDSHVQNEQYMNRFEQGFNTLSFQERNTKTSSSCIDTLQNNSIVLPLPDNMNIQIVDSYPCTTKGYSTSNKTSPFVATTTTTTTTTPAFTTTTDNSRSWYLGPKDRHGKKLQASSQNLLCMSSFENEIVVGSSDHALYTFNLTSGKKTRQLYSKQYGHTEWVTSVLHLPDGRIVSGGMDSKLCLWEKKGALCKDLCGHFGSISVIKANPLGSMVISSSYDKTLRSWDIHKKKEVFCFNGHTAPILDFIWSGHSLVSGGRDGIALLWDVQTGKCIHKFTGHQGHITCVAQYDDHETDCVLYMTGGQDGHVRVWDCRTPRCLFDLTPHTSSKNTTTTTCKSTGALCAIQTSSATTDPTTSYVVTAGADQLIQILDPRNSFRYRFTINEHSDFIYSLHTMKGLIFSANGRGELLVHDATQGKLLYDLGGNQAAIRCMTTTSSKLIASGDEGNVLIYDYLSE